MNYRGLILAAVQLAIVSSLGAKYLADREQRPRVWARALPWDPNLPVRGRYVRLQLRVENPPAQDPLAPRPVRPIATADGRLSAVLDPGGGPTMGVRPDTGTLTAPVAFFIPEHIPDPSIRAAGEELWVEVTIPKQGPPRPIRLGVKKDGVLTPLDIR